MPLAVRVELHRAALAELEARPADEHDLARLAHHADAAGDAPAVLRFAPRAAEQASALGAHREAAGQYRRALRYADGLAPAQRASLLQGYSGECYLTDQADEAIAALRSAADVYRALGDRLQEGATIGQLAALLWCPGRGAEARRVGIDSVNLLEQLPPTSELAYAYDRMSFLHRVNTDLESAEPWAKKATSVAETVGDANAVEWTTGGRELLEIMSGSSAAIAIYLRRADQARRRGQVDKVAETLDALVFALIPHHGYSLSRAFIEEGVTLSRECGHELSHVYLVSHRARLELNQGQWEDAAEFAEFVLGKRLVSTFPRSLALVSLALVRARRGDPDVWALLDEARDLSEPTGELLRIAPVAAARGEAAWLSGRSADVAPETDAAFELALSRSGAVGARRARRHSPACRNRGRPSEAASRAAHARDRGAVARSRDRVAQARPSLRGGARARRGRRERATTGTRGAPLARGPPGCPDRRSTPPRERAATHPGRAANLDENESGRIDGQRARSPGPDGRGVAERRDRRAAVPLAPHRGSPRFRRAAQARREDARRGGRAGATGKPARVPVARLEKLGGPADVPTARHP